MKNFISLLFLLISFFSFSQRKFSKEFSFVNDNDLYTSYYQDRYYTNGMFLSFRYQGSLTTKKIEKRIYEFKLGHKIFTPYKSILQSPDLHDRPFAGILFGSFGINNFYYSNSFIKASIEIGALGPNSLAEELQNFIHNMYGFKTAIGWQYQIKNALLANAKLMYGENLTKNNSASFDITWLNEASIGTVDTYLSSGFYGRIALKPLQKMVNSIAFNSNLNNKSSKYSNAIESFLYVKPSIHYTIYDATIQGSFLNTTSPITFEVIPIVFHTELGIRFTSGRFNFGYAVNFHTKKLKSIQVPGTNFYGSIQLNYQFN